MRKIRLDDSCLNHLTNIPVGLRLNPHTYIILRNQLTKNIRHFADRGCVTGGAYAPGATCITTPLFSPSVG